MTQRTPTLDFERTALAADVALFTVAGGAEGRRLRVLLVRRNAPPHEGMWALPGGLVRLNEGLSSAAARVLAEETGARGVVLEQVITVGRPGRDPRGHVVTVAWMGLAPEQAVTAVGGDAVAWFDAEGPEPLPPLAFDHAELLRLSLEHLRRRVGEAPVCFDLLPAEFTLSELQALLEAILGRPLDRRNLRRKVHELGFLEPTGGWRREGAHRPAALYRLVPEEFARQAARERALPF